MDLQLVCQPFGLLGRNRFIQTRRRVGVEVVHHHHDHLGVRVVNIDQIPDHGGKLDAASLVGDFDVAPAAQRFRHDEQVGRPVAFLFAVHPLGMSRRHRDRLPDFAQQLLAGFIQADLRSLGIIGALVDIQHVFQMPDKLRVLLGRNAPTLLQPRLEFIF